MGFELSDDPPPKIQIFPRKTKADPEKLFQTYLEVWRAYFGGGIDGKKLSVYREAPEFDRAEWRRAWFEAKTEFEK